MDLKQDITVPPCPAQISANGRLLEYYVIDGRDPALVFLHEGLGCTALWREFPARIAAATGQKTLVYSRYGYGKSEVRTTASGSDYMHIEGRETLPELLQALEISSPILVGHSDGASIALIYSGMAKTAVSGLVLMAPHVFVEPISVRSIKEAGRAFAESDMPTRMAKYHTNPTRTFHSWHDAWLSKEFLDWDLTASLPAITCPVLVIQGDDDEYGTIAQVNAIRSGVKGPCDIHILPNCGHAPQKDQIAHTADLIIDFNKRFVEKDVGL